MQSQILPLWILPLARGSSPNNLRLKVEIDKPAKRINLDPQSLFEVLESDCETETPFQPEYLCVHIKLSKKDDRYDNKLTDLIRKPKTVEQVEQLITEGCPVEKINSKDLFRVLEHNCELNAPLETKALFELNMRRTQGNAKEKLLAECYTRGLAQQHIKTRTQVLQVISIDPSLSEDFEFTRLFEILKRIDIVDLKRVGRSLKSDQKHPEFISLKREQNKKYIDLMNSRLKSSSMADFSTQYIFEVLKGSLKVCSQLIESAYAELSNRSRNGSEDAKKDAQKYLDLLF